jgi:nitrite reductase (NADH) large subunit
MKALIIGNGVAGLTAATTLRSLAPDANITILTSEPHHYYYRPRLPDLVAGTMGVDDIVINPPEWYASRGIDVRLSATVASIDPEARAVVLEDGERVDYDRLLIASGADPFVPPIDGADRDGVFTLRSANDALAIRARATTAASAVVIGGGLLGVESARGLRAHDLPVKVLEYADWLLPRQLDRRGAEILQADLSKRGIDVVTGARVSAITGGVRASGVSFEDGTETEADIVVISTGVRPTVGFLDGSGVEVGRGVVVGPDMQTSARGVYAAGDVAEFEGVIWGIIPIALAQAGVAARAIAGDAATSYRPVTPNTTLKMAGVDVFSAGTVTCEEGDCVERVFADEGAYLYRKVVVRGGVIVGAIVVGSKAGVRELTSMIERGTDVSAWGDAIVRDDFDFGAAQESAQ